MMNILFGIFKQFILSLTLIVTTCFFYWVFAYNKGSLLLKIAILIGTLIILAVFISYMRKNLIYLK